MINIKHVLIHRLRCEFHSSHVRIGFFLLFFFAWFDWIVNFSSNKIPPPHEIHMIIKNKVWISYDIVKKKRRYCWKLNIQSWLWRKSSAKKISETLQFIHDMTLYEMNIWKCEIFLKNKMVEIFRKWIWFNENVTKQYFSKF